jgi:5-methylthioadenosine/S-adenosylhomocysteine deaminase
MIHNADKFDILFTGVTVFTGTETLEGACLGVTGRKIAYVGSEPPAVPVTRVLHRPHWVLMPALRNAHTHLAMTLLRGYSDDVDLRTWLFQYIFPAEDRMTPADIGWGTRLALLEGIATGTVGYTDMYASCGEIAQAVADSGAQANISRGITMFEPDFCWQTNAKAAEADALVKEWHGYDGGRIKIDVGVHAEYTSYDTVWKAAAEYAGRYNLGMQVHISETKHEHEACADKYGATPAEMLNRSGLFGTRTAVGHGVWLTDGDIDILASHGAAVAHCPVSNLKLGCGVARLKEWNIRKLIGALGTDGCASNNTMDLFEEIKLAVTLQKNASLDSSAFLAAEGLRMATAGGAYAQGREGESGLLAAGMDADLIALDFDKPHLTPRYDALSHLAYAAKGSDVCLTMSRGTVLYEGGVWHTLDRDKILHEVRKIDLRG